MKRSAARSTLDAIVLFLLTSLPSLKLLYSSELWNALTALLILIALVTKIGKYLANIKLKILCVFFVFFSVLLISSLLNDTLGQVDLAKYIYFIFVVMSWVYIANAKLIEKYLILSIVWAVMLSFFQLTKGFSLNETLGQTYLTLSMPLGIGLTIALVKATTSESIGILSRFSFFCTSFIILLALSTLPSRSALIYPLTVVSMITVFSLFLSKTVLLKHKVLIIFFAVSGGFVTYTIFKEFLSEKTLNRLMRLMDSNQEEPRIQLYSYAWDLIELRAFIGYGRGDVGLLKDGYVHNILLDIALHGGVLMVIIFALFLLLYAVAGIKSLIAFSYNSNLISVLGCSAFLFLQWNTSFNLSNSYIPICLMTLLVISHTQISNPKIELKT